MFLDISFVIRTCKHKDKATYFNYCLGQLLSLLMSNLYIQKWFYVGTTKHVLPTLKSALSYFFGETVKY